MTFDESDKRFAFITHSECKNLQASAALQNIGKEEKMEYSKFKNDASVYESTARAEDGMPPRSRWNALCEGVLIPLGSLFAVFLAMLGLMLIAD